jgi:hypothetical protein
MSFIAGWKIVVNRHKNSLSFEWKECKKLPMKSQVKVFCCLALFVCTAVAETNWEALSTPRMEILNYSSAQGPVLVSHFPFFIDFGRKIWGWNPRNEPKNQSDKVYIKPRLPINETMENLFVDFDVSHTKHFRKVLFRPKPDLVFRGLFGIHDFDKKRPLVILRLGIHGNIDEFIAERFIGKALYEDLDANILVLESLTSHGFISSNEKISFGGVDEGLHTFFALKEIEKTPLKNFISSQHIVAVSMGGNGAFVTALMDQVNGRHLKSIVEFCPLINIEETINQQQKSGLGPVLVDLWNVRRLHSLIDRYRSEPDVKDWWKSALDLKPKFTPTVLHLINKERAEPLLTVTDLNGLFPGLKWPKGFDEHLRKSNSLFHLNDFWPWYQGVKTPVTIYTTPKDPLVPNEINAEKIFKGVQPGDFSSLKFRRLEKSTHCGLASVYQWDYIVNLLKDGLEL